MNSTNKSKKMEKSINSKSPNTIKSLSPSTPSTNKTKKDINSILEARNNNDNESFQKSKVKSPNSLKSNFEESPKSEKKESLESLLKSNDLFSQKSPKSIKNSKISERKGLNNTVTRYNNSEQNEKNELNENNNSSGRKESFGSKSNDEIKNAILRESHNNVSILQSKSNRSDELRGEEKDITSSTNQFMQSILLGTVLMVASGAYSYITATHFSKLQFVFFVCWMIMVIILMYDNQCLVDSGYKYWPWIRTLAICIISLVVIITYYIWTKFDKEKKVKDGEEKVKETNKETQTIKDLREEIERLKESSSKKKTGDKSDIIELGIKIKPYTKELKNIFELLSKLLELTKRDICKQLSEVFLEQIEKLTVDDLDFEIIKDETGRVPCARVKDEIEKKKKSFIQKIKDLKKDVSIDKEVEIIELIYLEFLNSICDDIGYIDERQIKFFFKDFISSICYLK